MAEKRWSKEASPARRITEIMALYERSAGAESDADLRRMYPHRTEATEAEEARGEANRRLARLVIDLEPNPIGLAHVAEHIGLIDDSAAYQAAHNIMGVYRRRML